jgi:hypothetical protein
MPMLRMLHVGDCSLRSMECSHDFRAPLGYPRVAAEALLEDGIDMEFSHYFAVLFHHLPDIPLLRSRMKLTGDPDVIVVQLGASYARRVILPDVPTVMRVRCDIGRRLGPRVFSAYRPLRPVVRAVGRHAAPYPGVEPFERFLTAVGGEWPAARIVVMQPFLGVYPYPTQHAIRARTWAHVHAAADRCGVAELDFTDLLGNDPSLRCANGHNLNARGSEMIGRELADWIRSSSSPRARPVVQTEGLAALRT